MKIKQDHAEQIALLFNTLDVSKDMRSDALKKEDLDMVYLWWRASRDAAVKLYENYGIKCVCYDLYMDMGAKA